MTFDKPINSEHNNLRATLALLSNASRSEVQAWFETYDWAGSDARSLGWTILDSPAHIRDYLLAHPRGFICVNDRRHDPIFRAALLLLMNSQQWEVLDRTLKTFENWLSNRDLQPLEAGIDKDERFGMDDFAETLIGMEARADFATRYLLAPSTAYAQILWALVHEKEAFSWDYMISCFARRMIRQSTSEEDMRWCLSTFPQHISEDVIHDIKWRIHSLAMKLNHEDPPSNNLCRALFFVDYHVNVAPILGQQDIDYRGVLSKSYVRNISYVKWGYEYLDEFIDTHAPVHTARALLECIKEHDLWSEFDSQPNLARKAIGYMLRWKSVPGFMVCDDQILIRTLALGSRFWDEDIIKQINERYPNAGCDEIGFLLSCAPSVILRSRFPVVNDVYTQDMTWSIDWASIAFDKKEISALMKDMDFVLDQSKPQHLMGLLKRLEKNVDVKNWPKWNEMSNHGNRWFWPLPQEHLIEKVKLALLQNSTDHVAGGYDRVFRL